MASGSSLRKCSAIQAQVQWGKPARRRLKPTSTLSGFLDNFSPVPYLAVWSSKVATAPSSLAVRSLAGTAVGWYFLGHLTYIAGIKMTRLLLYSSRGSTISFSFSLFIFFTQVSSCVLTANYERLGHWRAGYPQILISSFFFSGHGDGHFAGDPRSKNVVKTSTNQQAKNVRDNSFNSKK